MSEHNGSPDSRPRPKYGELAPEGWVWRPPADVSRLDTSKPLAPVSAPVAPAPDSYRPPGGGPVSAGRAASWDRSLTLALLVFGALGMFVAIATITALPQSIQLLYVSNNLGTYKPASSVPTIMLIGQIVQGALWVATVIVSVTLLSRQRRAFFVPLIAGVVSSIALVLTVMIIVSSDATLVNYYSSASA